MHCPNCGTELTENAKFCTNCGEGIDAAASASPSNEQADAVQASNLSYEEKYESIFDTYQPVAPEPQMYGGPSNRGGAEYVQSSVVPPAPTYVQSQPVGGTYPMTSTDRTLRLIAFILTLVTTICMGFAIFPLIWMVPMTVVSWRIYKGTRRNTVAFGVCTLLFVSIISGILLLCSHKDD